MKKFINIALYLSVIAGTIPMSASAKSEPIFLENGSEHWEYTAISGDVNGDGALNIADALLLQKCIMNKYDYLDEENLNKCALDVNFDGSFDAFDLVQIRKLVLNPEKAEKQTWAVDILNTDAEIPTYEEKNELWEENPDSLDRIITTYDEMSAYLKNFITDNDELQKYLDKYNKTFFEENNIILEPFIQERGNGIFVAAGATYKLNNISFNDKIIDNGVFFYIGSNYKEDMGLYPVTNTKMLAQIAIPKSQTSAENKILYIDIQDGLLSEQNETVSYTDGTHEIVITQENGWGLNANIYIKNDDNSFTYLTSIYPQCCFNDGELSNGDYTITFCDDAFLIDYRTESVNCRKLQSSYDGENIVEFSEIEPAYKSPDGETELYFDYNYYSSNNGGDIAKNTLIDIYLKESDGYLKYIGNLTASGYNMPFKESGEWSVDSDENNIFSNGDTYSITWLENSVIVDYQSDGNQWAKGEINFDGSATDVLQYWK